MGLLVIDNPPVHFIPRTFLTAPNESDGFELKDPILRQFPFPVHLSLGHDPSGQFGISDQLSGMLAFVDLNSASLFNWSAERLECGLRTGFIGPSSIDRVHTGSTIVGMVHGSADKAGEIKSNKKLMAQADELGKELVTG